jgi:hypothetical protein
LHRPDSSKVAKLHDPLISIQKAGKCMICSEQYWQ